MRAFNLSHVLTVLVSVSYLTLGVLAPSEAEQHWAPYALLVLVLAVWNLLGERNHERRRRGPRVR